MRRWTERLRSLFLAIGATATVLAAVPVRDAGAADMIEGYVEVYSGVCANQRLLGTIQNRFRHQVTHVPNLPDVRIVDFQRIYEKRYLPAEEEWPIGRRYCAAKATLSDGHVRDVWYLVEEGQGFASIGDNVEFCVAGFDRWLVYNSPWCRVLR